MDQFTTWLKHFFFGILILFAILNLFSFLTASTEPLINLFDDDAYYYFTIARNFSETGRLSFDGQTLTNGFQPLWFFLLLPLFLVVHDPLLVLRCVGVLCTLLSLLAGWLALRYLQRHSLLPFTLGATLSLYVLFSLGVTGMETALVFPLVMTSLLLVERFLASQSSIQALRLSVALGLSLAALLLARLDAIWLVAALLGGAWLLHFRTRIKLLLIASGIPTLSLLLYLLSNHLLFGNLMPTSGTAKSLGGNLFQWNSLFFAQVTHPGDPANGNLWVVYGASLLIAAAYLVHLLISSRKRPRGNGFLPACISIALLLFTAYELFITKWVLWRWYAWLLFPVGVVLYPYLLEAIQARLSVQKRLTRPLAYSALLLGTLGCMSLLAATLNRGLWRYTEPPAFRYENYQLAQQLNTSLPADTIIAMGDRAGSFAWFFDGHVLQLEGLVGDEQLLEAIREDALEEYLTGFGVDYVLTYVDSPADYERWELLTPLPGFTIGAQAGISVCRENEVLRYITPYQVLTLWRYPACPP
jgi:hypothetical protein